MRPPRMIVPCLAVLAVLASAPAAARAEAIQPTIEVTQSRGTNALTEGESGYSLAFALSTAPAEPVVITLTGTGLIATPAVLTFTPTNARTPQAAVISVLDDTIASDGATRTLHATSTSNAHAFDDLSQTIDILVLDDDGVALDLDATGASTTVVEAGATDSVSIRLGTRPRQPVSVFLSGVGIDVVPDMVVVRPDQWSAGIPVTVVAHDDSFLNGSRTTSLTARTVAPDSIWTDRTASLFVTIEDDDQRLVRDGGPDSPTEIPVSRANRTPRVPTLTLATTSPEGSSVVVRFSSTDADGDPVRYRVLSRTLAVRDRVPQDWKLVAETTSTRFDSDPIAPLEQRCFRIEAVDPLGAAATTAIACTHGLAEASTVAANYGWKSRPMRGASNGTISEPTARARLVYFTHTGVRAELTFLRCRTCASIRMVDPDGTNRTFSLRGTGRLVVRVPLNSTGRRIWGFYVQGPGTVLFDTFAVLRPT